MLEPPPRSIPPEPQPLPHLPHPLPHPINNNLHQPPPSLPPPLSTQGPTDNISPTTGIQVPGRVLAPHTRQDILTCAQADEQGERDEPDADAEVGGYFGERGTDREGSFEACCW